MNILNNKNKRTSIFKALALCLFAAVSLTLASCDDDMDIQQSYPFTVETMPVPNKVTKGQTVEIRCELKRTGEFANTLYTIRYFQFEGEGTLKMAGGITFLPNDRYLLENDKFRLYYTADGDEAHNFIVVVDDACIHGYPLFAAGGLLRVRTGQPSEGDGRAGGNLPPAAFRVGSSVYEVF